MSVNHVKLRPTISLVTFLWPTSYLDKQCLLLLHIVYACKLGRVYILHTKNGAAALRRNCCSGAKPNNNWQEWKKSKKKIRRHGFWDIYRPAILYKNKTIFHNPNKTCGLCCAITSYRKSTENSGYLSDIWCGDILRGDSWGGSYI